MSGQKKRADSYLFGLRLVVLIALLSSCQPPEVSVQTHPVAAGKVDTRGLVLNAIEWVTISP